MSDAVLAIDMQRSCLIWLVHASCEVMVLVPFES
jgi:hypothetical protein